MLIDCHNSYCGHKSSSRRDLGLRGGNTLLGCTAGNNSLGTGTAGDRPGIDSRPGGLHRCTRTSDSSLADTSSAAGSFDARTDSDTYLLEDANLDLTF